MTLADPPNALPAAPPPAIPVLVTARLRLRAHTPADLAACTAMWADPQVIRFTGGRAFTREETWARMLRYTGHWTWFGHGFWAVEDAETGAFVGEFGFADFQRELVPSLDGIPELGWALASAVHGRGFASEAVRAALAWSDANLAAARTACIIDPGNAASIRVAQRCGYRETLRTRYKGSETLLFERARTA